MNGGCNSCEYLDPKNKKPGRTSGYLFYCKATGKYVNAAKESCDNYSIDNGRTGYEVNDIYKDSANYNDMYNSNGCNSCRNLDPEAKKPGKTSGAQYFCKVKNTYVDATSNACENYEDGFRNNDENNKIYKDSKEFNDNSTSIGSYLFILALLIIFALIYSLFLS